MEEQVVEILVNAWGQKSQRDFHTFIDLYLVNLETGNVTSYGGDKLYGASSTSAMVPLGDDIYIVGGDEIDSYKKTLLRDHPDMFVHSMVSRINVYDIDGGWKKVTPFNTPVMGYKSKMFPSVTLNNKLYVFGDTFGEVYDPKSPNQWASLPSLPSLPPVLQGNIYGRRARFPRDSDSLVGFPVFPDSGKNRIILHLPRTDSIYAYYPDKLQWQCLVNDFDSWCDIAVLFDDMLLFYYPPNNPVPIRAYDLETNKWLNSVSAPESDTGIIYKHCDFFDVIIPMEQPLGTFYLAASRAPFDTDGTTLIFVKFTVHRPNKSEDLVFNFVSSQKLCFNWPCQIFSYLPVVGKMSKLKDTLEEVSEPMDMGASSFEKHCTTQRSSKRANVSVVDCSLKSTAELVNPTDIWNILKDMEVADNTACYNFLVKDPNSLIALHAIPIQKRKQVLEILMAAY